MSRFQSRAGCLALLLAFASAARAQSDEPAASALPAVNVPNSTSAAAEEPAGLSINPAAPGFVRHISAQYFHEQRGDVEMRGDAVYLSTPIGPLVPTLALDWIRPESATRFRRTTLGLALGGDDISVGYAYTWYSSADPFVDAASSWQAGLTIRPLRWLSVAGSALDRGMDLGRMDVAARYAVGAAARFWQDRVTVSSDLLASDRAVNAFDPNGLAFGVNAEVWRGLAVNVQVKTPIDEPGTPTTTFVALTWNEPHAGYTGAYTGSTASKADAWSVGLRLSREAYRSDPPRASRTVRVDLARDLERGGFLIFPGKTDPYGTLLGKLRDLGEDASVRGVQLVVDDLPLGTGRTQELRTAIAALAARKPVVAWLRGGTLREYWLATAATSIATPPSGVVDLSGLASTTPFLRDGLAKIGVAFEVVAAGRYKNAPDPLVRSDMSEAQREVTDDLLDAVFSAVVTDVAAARRVPEQTVAAWMDQALFTAGDARSAGLIDEVSWPDELGKAVRDYDRAPHRRAQRWGPRPVIAIVPIEGAIVQGKNRRVPLYGQAIGDETIASEIRRAAEEDRVAAIVLRIDSPGGDAVASDLIWRAVGRARDRGIPVIASMGDVAASGGYLVACGADTVFAEPTTLTGSIGVFVVKPDFSGLLAKLGVNTVTVQRGENATVRSTTKPWSDSERAAVERAVHGFYDVFLARVAEGRHMPTADVEEIAGGRVWTGAEAAERGLVDRLGSLSDAVALARERAHIGAGEDVTIRRYEPAHRLVLDVSGGSAPDALSAVARRVPELAAAGLLLEIGAPVALPLDWVSAGDAANGQQQR